MLRLRVTFKSAEKQFTNNVIFIIFVQCDTLQ
jgi:hypothetical protein